MKKDGHSKRATKIRQVLDALLDLEAAAGDCRQLRECNSCRGLKDWTELAAAEKRVRTAKDRISAWIAGVV